MKSDKRLVDIIKKVSVAILCLGVFLSIFPIGFIGEAYANEDTESNTNTIVITVQNNIGKVVPGLEMDNLYLTYKQEGKDEKVTCHSFDALNGIYIFDVDSGQQYQCVFQKDSYVMADVFVNKWYAGGQKSTITVLYTKTPTVSMTVKRGEEIVDIGDKDNKKPVVTDIGDKVTFSVTAQYGDTDTDTNTGFVYKWYKDENEITNVKTNKCEITVDGNAEGVYKCKVYSVLSNEQYSGYDTAELVLNKYMVTVSKSGQSYNSYNCPEKIWMKDGDSLKIAPKNGYYFSQDGKGGWTNREKTFSLSNDTSTQNKKEFVFYLSKNSSDKDNIKVSLSYEFDNVAPGCEVVLAINDDSTWKLKDGGRDEYGVIVRASDAGSGVKSVQWKYAIDSEWTTIDNVTQDGEEYKEYKFYVTKSGWLKNGNVQVKVTDCLGNEITKTVNAIGMGLFANNSGARGYNENGLVTDGDFDKKETTFYVNKEKNDKYDNYIVFSGLDLKNNREIEIKNNGNIIWRSDMPNGSSFPFLGDDENEGAIRYNNCLRRIDDGTLYEGDNRKGLAWYKLEEGMNDISISFVREQVSSDVANPIFFSDTSESVNTDGISSLKVVVDNTKPIISLASVYQEKDEEKNEDLAPNGNALYYKDKINVKIKIEEKYFDTNGTTVSVKRTTAGGDEQDYPVKQINSDNSNTNDGWTNKDGVYEKTIVLGEDSGTDKGEGTYKITVTSTDKAGNEGKLISCPIVIDKTAPEISIERVINDNENDNLASDGDNSEQALYYNAGINVKIRIKEENFQGDGDNTGVQVERIDVKQLFSNNDNANNGWTYKDGAYEKTIKLGDDSETDNGEGTYEITVTSTDKAGNKGELTSRPIVIDKTTPEISIEHVYKDNGEEKNEDLTSSKDENLEQKELYYNDEINATIKVKEKYFDADKTEVSVTYIPFGEAAGANTGGWVGNGEGVYEKTIKAKIEDGGWEYDGDNHIYTITVPIGKDNKEKNDDNQVDNNDDSKAYDNGEGTYKITVTSTDKAGNEGTKNSRPIVIDKAAPEISAVYADDDNPEAEENTYLYYDNGIPVTIGIKEYNFVKGKTSISVTFKPFGGLTGVEKVGWVYNEDTGVYEKTIKSEPDNDIWKNEKDGVYETTIPIGNTNEEENDQGNDNRPENNDENIVDDDQGIYVITVNSTDESENDGTLTSYSVVIDRTKPVVEISSPVEKFIPDIDANEEPSSDNNKPYVDNEEYPIYQYREIKVTIKDAESGVKTMDSSYGTDGANEVDDADDDGLKIPLYKSKAEENSPIYYEAGDEIIDGWIVEAVNGCFVTQISKTFVFGVDDKKENDLEDNNLEGDDPKEVALNGQDGNGFTVAATYVSDRTGNKCDNTVTNPFTIDRTAPLITVSFLDNNSENTSDEIGQVSVPLDEMAVVNGYYNISRIATITIAERNFNPENISININGVKIPDDDITFDGSSESGYKYSTSVPFEKDGNYTFNVSGTDMAGHAAQVDYSGGNENEFCIDKIKPVISVAYNKAKEGVYDGERKTYYKNSNDFDVTIKEINFREDGENTPVKVQYKNAEGQEEYDYSVEEWKTQDGDKNSTTISLEKGEGTYVVTVDSNDKAGNKAEQFISEKMVVDTTAPEVTIGDKQDKEEACLNTDRKQLTDRDGNPIYRYREITVTAEDSVSGIQSIDYKYGEETKKHYSDFKLEIGPGEYEVGQVLNDGWIVDSVYENVVTKIHKKFVFGIDKNTDSEYKDDNGIQLSMTVLNNSGLSKEVKEASNKFTIDQTIPQITVDFGEDDDTDTYYDAYRQATITVVERNFNPALIVATIKNDNGDVPSLSEFKDEGGYKYTATVSFKDGDYSFSVEGKDMGWNKAAVTYTGGNEKHFFVDTTTPVITTNFDEFIRDIVDVEFADKNDFDTTKTVAITVNDHNFDQTKSNLKVYYKAAGSEHSNEGWEDQSGMYDGGWKDDGDIHTLSFTLEMDGVYRMEIAPVDKAGNSAELITSEIFEIDTTVPVISARNGMYVEANSTEFFDVYYYERKDEATPTIEFSDSNFEYLKYELTIWRPVISEDGIITAYEGKNIFVDGDAEGRGRITSSLFTMPAFENEGDGVYELVVYAVDSAGNSSKVNYDTYARIVDNDVIAYINDSSIEKNTGLYSFTYEDLTPISMRPDSFKDLTVTVIARNNSDVDVVLRDTNSVETQVKTTNEEDNSVEGFTIHTMSIAADYFKDAFADDTDSEFYLAVNNTVRDEDGKKVNRIDLGKIHIDSIVPTCTLPDDFKSWHWFPGKDSRTITLTDISEILDGDECVVYDNGVPMDFVYDSVAGTLTFVIGEGWHDIGVSISDMAGNINSIQEVKKIHIGYFWLWVIIGGACVVAGVVILVVVRNAKKRREAED